VEQDWETGRIEAFSDGVLAIAITLLVLEIRLPDDTRGHLAHDLRALAPSYAAYALSFLVIGIMWANHHGLFRLIARADEGLLFFNVVLLAGISFLPFPTAVLARALKDGTADDRTAALLLYGGVSVFVAIGYQLVWHYARLRGLLLDGLDPAVIRELTRGFSIGILLYLAAIPLAFVSAAASMAVWAGLALFFLRGTPKPRFTEPGGPPSSRTPAGGV
jgi:uncharacterized membrane protein